MEQFLNLLWLAIALITTLIWRMGWLRERRSGHYAPLHEAARLGCALLLLFFTISMTDDLHAEMILIEGSDQRHSIVIPSPDQTFHGGISMWTAFVAILPARVALELHHAAHDLSPAVEICQSVTEKPLPPDRSPPASSMKFCLCG
jgi:hypothetical protein